MIFVNQANTQKSTK